jgi:hypothetical protein
VTGDFIAGYFPREQRLAVFYTQPLVPTYPMPEDAYWIQQVAWDPVTSRIDDVFGAECVMPDTLVETPNGRMRADTLTVGQQVIAITDDNDRTLAPIVSVRPNTKSCRRLQTTHGDLVASLDHRIKTEKGWLTLAEILEVKPRIWVLVDQQLVLESVTCIGDSFFSPVLDFQLSGDSHAFVTGCIVSHNSFLFCLPGGSQVLTVDGPKICEEVAEKPTRLITPFGPVDPLLRWNATKQPIQVMQTAKDFLCCTPNHPVFLEHRFRMAFCGYPGLHLRTERNEDVEIVDRDRVTAEGTWSIHTKTGCYFASALGKQWFLVH